MIKSQVSDTVKEEVKGTINNVVGNSDTVASEREAFRILAEQIEIEDNAENFVYFQSAVSEISSASYEACHGSSDKLVQLEGQGSYLVNYFA